MQSVPDSHRDLLDGQFATLATIGQDAICSSANRCRSVLSQPIGKPACGSRGASGEPGRGTRRASRAKWSRLIPTHAGRSASVASTMPQRLLHPGPAGLCRWPVRYATRARRGAWQPRIAVPLHDPCVRSSTCAYTSAGPRRALSICRPSRSKLLIPHGRIIPGPTGCSNAGPICAAACCKAKASTPRTSSMRSAGDRLGAPPGGWGG